ncbi:MAG: WbqC family protein [Muribaculaceae bacterium]|nr:WbqC family protein [Muribaculaceae bacterium]
MIDPQRPLLRFPDSTVILAPSFLGSISRYALIAAFGNAIVDTSTRFDKRLKSTHRTTIADVNGEMKLTLPISKPESLTRATWNDIRISDHGQWWHLHLTALESAYGRTPFFEFYIDKFTPFFNNEAVEKYETLVNYDQGHENVISEILGIKPPEYKTLNRDDYNNATDFSRTDPNFDTPPYYQVRADRLGFIPDLSIVDLIFNLGPESPLLLKKITDNISL